MDTATFSKWSGLPAMLGGAAWLATVILYGMQPQGPGTEPREGWFPLSVGIAVSLALLTPAIAGVHLRQRPRGGALSTTGAALGVAGVAAAGVVWVGTMLDLVPLGPPMVIALGVTLLGQGLLGYSVVKAQVLSPGVGALLGLGTLGFLRGNFEDASIFLFIPFGVAWLWLGYLMAGDDDEDDF